MHGDFIITGGGAGDSGLGAGGWGLGTGGWRGWGLGPGDWGLIASCWWLALITRHHLKGAGGPAIRNQPRVPSPQSQAPASVRE
jgi:hypothetical protein